MSSVKDKTHPMHEVDHDLQPRKLSRGINARQRKYESESPFFFFVFRPSLRDRRVCVCVCPFFGTQVECVHTARQMQGSCT